MEWDCKEGPGYEPSAGNNYLPGYFEELKFGSPNYSPPRAKAN